jgi:hypothetical protein
LDSMSVRKKRLTVAGCAALILIVCFWSYWSPRAAVKGHFSFHDLASIRWLVRGETFESILSIIEQPDGTAMVWTGRQTTPLAGGGLVFTLVRTNGWKITERGGWQSLLSNPAAPGNGAMASLFHTRRPGRAVPEPGRWPRHHVFSIFR